MVSFVTRLEEQFIRQEHLSSQLHIIITQTQLLSSLLSPLSSLLCSSLACPPTEGEIQSLIVVLKFSSRIKVNIGPQRSHTNLK